jgi:cytochrome c556
MNERAVFMARGSKVLMVLALALLPALTPAAAADKDVVAYRQHIMKTLNEQTAALGQILSGVVPDDNVLSHLDALALTASTALKAFEPKVPGGESKPEVWSNWADFSKRMKDFAEKTALMAKAGREEGKDAGLTHAIDALSCKSCHDTYSTVTLK